MKDVKVQPDERNYRNEMEMLIRKEAGRPEGSLTKSVLERGEAGAHLKVSREQPSLAVSADMLQILSEQAGLPYAKITDYPIKDLKLLQLVPAQFAKEYKVFPLREEPDGSIIVAISDPLNITIVDDLRLLLDRAIKPIVCAEEEILDNIDQYYGMGDETIEQMVEEFEKEGSENVLQATPFGEMDLTDLERIAHEPPVIKLVNLLLLQAIKDRASDLHIEPFSGRLRIRYRVDGALREIPAPPKSLQVGLCSRLKVLSSMDIAENRLPQDGRIRLTISGREIDLRLSTIPTVHGESIVMRILDKSMMLLGVGQLGMTKETMELFMSSIHKPNGIILASGPTGCGKTTTLYAAVTEINDPTNKLITVEDPVEFEIPGLVQVNANPGVGLTFAEALKAMLHQDPDIILVGEIRDLETAQIAIQAALTGHLVLTTIHTNSAAATITRIVDIGVEPFLLSSTLEAIIGQRLLRTICPNCKKPYIPTDMELEDFGVTRAEVSDITFYKGDGCEECSHSGYKGRMGIFEILHATDEIKELSLQRATTDQIHALAVQQGMRTMRNDGWLKICLGVTTFDEVARQTPKESKEQIEKEMESVLEETIGKVRTTRNIETTTEPTGKEKPPRAAEQPETRRQPFDDEAAMPPYNAGDAQKKD
jgi:type II secretion system protein E